MNPESQDLHSISERRSLAYHRAIAQKISNDTSLLQRVRKYLDREDACADKHRAHWAKAWRPLIDGPTDALLDFMVSEHAYATNLRQSSPFAGLLSPHERWAIWRRYRRPSRETR